ncbi:16S rRNA (cytosine(1407)-C(5))-methyltransferase RsmF, partial [Vibrio fluvialis]|nr:16S rRNA (cytosine(1407)-C(5))-methyltransferase RsmF [Vibrio fluvialis]
EGFLHIFPQVYDSEGFFVARIRKLASVNTPDVNKKMGKFPFQKASKKESALIEKSLSDSLDISLPADSTIWLRDNDVWLFPNALEPMLGELRFSRMGIKLAEKHKNGYRWQHQIATTLASGDEKTVVDIDTDAAREWFMGRDIYPENSGK